MTHWLAYAGSRREVGAELLRRTHTHGRERQPALPPRRLRPGSPRRILLAPRAPLRLRRYRVRPVIDFWRYRPFAPLPKLCTPRRRCRRVTVQLPLYNEAYGRRAPARGGRGARLPARPSGGSGPRRLDDETRELARAAVERLRGRGLDAPYVHRGDRSGFKAGALEAGLRTARRAYSPSSTPTSSPAQTLRRSSTSSRPLVACAQMRWRTSTGAQTCSRASRPSCSTATSSRADGSQPHGRLL